MIYNLVMRFYYDPHDDPTCFEDAAVFESAHGAPPFHRHISIYDKSGELKNIDFDSQHYDSMSYMLIWQYFNSS